MRDQENKQLTSLLNSTLKLGRLFECSKITADEYAQNLLEHGRSLTEFDSETIRAIATSVPSAARQCTLAEISRILSAGYRFSGFAIGGRQPSPDDRERMRLQDEMRIRAFAGELKPALNLEDEATSS